MQPHQQRVVEEKAQLDERLGKLQTFVSSIMFPALPMEEQERMRTQLHLMRALSTVLEARINAFA